MTEKELKKLNRAELLELLLVQTKEAERLRKKLEKAEAALADRYLQIQSAGTLAQAVVQINGVMEAAQAAAQQYLDNIVKMEEETRLRCEKMLADAGAQAERIRRGAPSESDKALLDELYELLDE